MKKKSYKTAPATAAQVVSNNLLAALSAGDLALLTPHLSLIQFEDRSVICEPGDNVEYAYFPCGATLVSYMVLLEDARGVETVLIGREGAVGGIVSHGHLPAYCQAVVQFPGPALRIACAELEKAKRKSVTLHHFFARYADCLLAQMFQSVACNATHTIEQRAAKWITAAQERTGNHDMPLTQEHLASLLGVGRSYVTRVIGGLKARGGLETSRGHLSVKDVKKLKKMSCACNDLVRDHFDAVLTGIYPKN